MSPVNYRKTWRFGPRWLHIKLTVSKTGWSWSFYALGASYNTRSEKVRVDLPGPFSWTSAKKRRKPKPRTSQRVS